MFRAIESSLSPATSGAAAAEEEEDIHFYASSGGNAGLACVTAANALGRPATIVVPLTTTPRMIARLRALGAADVVQVGKNWAAADAHLREVVMPAFEARGGARARAVYVPPFDHRDVWDGAATMVDELEVQIAMATAIAGDNSSNSRNIDGIVCSVGGGGLLCGVMQGVQRLKEEADGRGSGSGSGGVPRVLAVETRGGDSLNASVRAGELVTLPAITTIATSLGATRVAEEAFAWTRRAGGDLVSAVVTDEEAVSAMSRFLDDERMLVESACGATIATAYNGDLRRYLGDGLTDEQWAAKNVVLIVCGGSNINLEMLQKYKADFGV